jgi:palmitoyl transferase
VKKFSALFLLSFFLFFFYSSALANIVESDEHWYQSMLQHVRDIWNEGNTEMYLPLRTIHMPFAYSHEQREHFTESPLGLGIGKGRLNNSGNYEGMLVMAFQDSHAKPQYLAAYQWIPQWSLSENIKTGVGAMGFLSARTDFLHYTPFPGILPVVSISYKNAMLEATYIPQVSDTFSGNVVFMMLKVSF